MTLQRAFVVTLLIIPLVNAAHDVQNIYSKFNRYSPGEDSISQSISALAPIRNRLGQLGVRQLGYRAEPNAYWSERVGDFFVIQYALAPVVLHPYSNERTWDLINLGPPVRSDRWVLVNYSAVGKSFRAPDIECVQDFGGGLALYRKGHPVSLAALGTVWKEAEGQAVGTWTRVAGNNTFEAVWRFPDGHEIRDEVELESAECHEVVLFRRGTNGRYRGRLSLDYSKVENGTGDWFSPGATCSATIK